MGLQQAGFDVTGVDIRPQPRYPFRFIEGDALTAPLDGYDLIWAGPPCQGYSTQTAVPSRHRRMIPQMRARLQATGIPYVIENVEGARKALQNPRRLCGSSFGLNLRRHRYFEASFSLTTPPCNHQWQQPRFRSLDITIVRAGRLASVVGVHGHLNYPGEFALRCHAMGIDWMTNDELVEAIPPVYAECIGRQVPHA